MAEYIEREALNKELQKKIELSRKARYALIEEDFVDIINDMPAADVAEVKHGKWTYIPHYNGFYDDAYMCGVCKGISVVKGKYCPNCGARMDGEGE